MDVNALYNEWLEKADGDPDLKVELESIKGKDDEILDRFYRSLEFGTAGLRGVIGAGTNRMNIYTVGRATQGLSDFLNKNYENPSIAIGYDSRIKSDYFSKEAASILAANGIKVYIYEELEPTPCLSFAIRHFHTSSGIILTASHNPAKYNGYKCYNPKGYQMTDEEAAETYDFIQKVDYFTGIKKVDFDEAVADGRIEYIGQEVIDVFLDEVQKQCINPEIVKAADLKVIYTPLNGTGNKPVRQILDRIGIDKVYVVPEQENPDGNFPTCPFPNPEIKQVFEIGLEMNKNIGADILLATDPDCDRVGIAVPDKSGELVLMSGNEVGAMLLNYILSERKAKGTLPTSAVAVKSFVSTDLAEVIAKKYNCTFKNLLTGFKYIGELITNLEEEGRASDFVMGFEESYGYLAGTHARDKDAVVASMLICEMAAFYKSKGMNLVDVMNSLYDEFGYYNNTVESYTFEGAAGMEKMAGIMDALRANAPEEIGGYKVVAVSDYKTSKTTFTDGGEEAIDLPKSNVLAFALDGGNKVIVRPSGTEPKIKAYITAIGDSKDSAAEIADKLIAAANEFMK
ncbi:MAG: phospho-sugar mutase [Eubacterium sp.]|nr:phospho-sugar mutase [Eubacterium sp.]MBQ8980078.1 phospho-sugar mutase [Eubacterium sp.]MBR1531371.1 phospho-sugar mutase [Eubacterium sp.]MBR2278510.1 phospho-sugar mutase [Eubacterium sp.]